ncbi:hypothetical protein KC318_g3124 [Hortaea werneckii]|nr:hypothetical protein KC334_g3301 [Hortaea werneckii]KAI7019136.1 hypothetical protein KC355_g3134 [Hortaea werneckii]KAI7202546.1 hypothetical protein KC324_g1672 [Hortaea werneckii]KAI7588864.1 hypothetical protein KC316_g4249 [Hortaea werneckii]KAI7672009.1 hypothetical protein KC318_g3124 [Hortaea werneckii]
MLTISCVVIVVFSKTDIVNATTTLNPAIIIPFVGTTTDALVGGVICQYSGGVNARLAIPIIVSSYMICGLGFFVAILIWAAYFVKLMNSGLPPPHLTPSLIMLVGPAGQTAAALQVLGTAAKTYFGAYDKGTFLQTQAGEMLATLGVMLGLFVIGIGLLFAIFDHLEKVHGVEFERRHGGNEAVKRAAYSRRFRTWLIQNNYPPELDAFFTDVKDGISGRNTGFVADDNAIEVQGSTANGATRNRGESSGALASSPHPGKTTRKPKKPQISNEVPTTTSPTSTATRGARSEDEGDEIRVWRPADREAVIENDGEVHPPLHCSSRGAPQTVQPTGTSTPPNQQISAVAPQPEPVIRPWRIHYTIHAAGKPRPTYTTSKDLSCIRGCRGTFANPNGPFNGPFAMIDQLARHYKDHHRLKCEVRWTCGETVAGMNIARLELTEKGETEGR